MMRALILLLLLCTGCGALWSSQSQREPMVPTPGEGGDLVFLRTGDRAYYYVVDKKRAICFFHATMYGKKHLEPIDCQKLEEAAEILSRAGHTPTPPPQAAPPAPPAPATAPPATDPAPTPTALTNEDRQSFRRAYIQHFCARRQGRDEPLDVFLTRHALPRSRWDTALKEFSADRDLWSALTSEAVESCQ